MKIVLSGVVGVGKSTISEKLATKLNFKVMEEPVLSNPYLDNFYKNPKDFSFKMQIFMLMARSKQLKEAKDLENIIFDRSILEDPIFVEVLKEQGYINKLDYKTYYDFYNNVIISSLYFDPHITPDLIIYLRVSTKEAINRINLRGRKSEKQADHSYWTLLNQKYEEWVAKQERQLPFLIIDTDNKNPETIVVEILAAISKIK